MFHPGLVEIYTGDGKGKTTAALGLAMRAMGYGLKVAVVQFLKGGNEPGEVRLAKDLPLLDWYRFGTGEFIFGREPYPEEIALARKGLCLVEDLFMRETCSMVIMDEVSNAINVGLLQLSDVLAVMEKKPQAVELVMTGRDFPQILLERADLVSEIRMVKHPYEQGITAREGIEY